jgi:hypothetical protein
LSPQRRSRLGDNDQAITWLRKALSERSMFVVQMTWDARLDGRARRPAIQGAGQGGAATSETGYTSRFNV